MQKELSFENYFYNRFGFYNYEWQKAAKHSYFKELLQGYEQQEDIKENGLEYAIYHIINNIIVYDHIEYCEENNLKPV